MTKETRSKSYSELIQLPTFEDRLRYLMLYGKIGYDTFGYDRFLNQDFYRSKEWHQTKSKIILRDLGCDLGIKGHEIPDGLPVYIHHINPITVDDILNHDPILLDPENLITTIFNTHQIIHYGPKDANRPTLPLERSPNDTCPWRS